MDSNASLNTLVRGDPRVALGHARLHLDGGSRRLDHAAEVNHCAVARALDEPAVVERDRRVDEVAAQSSQSPNRPLFVGASKPAEADDVGNQDHRDFPRFGHISPFRTMVWTQKQPQV